MLKKILLPMIALTAFMLCGLGTPVHAADPNPDLLVVEDDYKSLQNIDQVKTDAEVDTDQTGVVMLPLYPSAVSLRKGTNEMAVREQDAIKIYGPSKSGVTQVALISLPGVKCVSYSKDGRFLYACNDLELIKYAPTTSGNYQLVSKDAIGSGKFIAVEGGKSNEVWVLTNSGLELWQGLPDGSYLRKNIVLVKKGKGISYSSETNSLVVLDGEQIRYFRVSGLGATEVSSLETSVPEALAVAHCQGGYRVLTKDGGSRYFLISGNSVVPVTSFNDVVNGYALTISPTNGKDYVAVTKDGVQYRSFCASPQEFAVNTPKSVTTPMQVGYKAQAVVYSGVFESSIPVDKVRANLVQVIPPSTKVELDVSVDGGVSWVTNVPLDTTVPVPVQGNKLMYRITLESTDPSLTPKVDFVQLLQIYVRQKRGLQGNGHVKLVP